MEKTSQPLSNQISDYLKLMEQAKKDYDWYQEELIRLEQLTQDYLHKLELTEMPYHEQAKTARKLKECRKERRKAKEIITVTEPIVDFLNSEKGQMMVNQIQQVLGKVRKAEKNAALLQYAPRVLTMEEYLGGKGYE